MKYLLTTILLLASTFTHADSLYLGAWSQHINQSEQVTNETHYLIGYEKNNWMLATFKNSYDDQTYLLSYQYRLPHRPSDTLAAHAWVGVSHGYTNCNGFDDEGMNAKYCFNAALEISYIKYNLQPAVIFTKGIVIATFKYKW